MELDFISEIPGFDQYEDVYLSLLKRTLNHLRIKADVILSVSLIDNTFIHKLNKEYRGVDRPTDVISFAFLDGDKNRDKKLKKAGPLSIGEIYISVEKAEEQAKEYSHSLEREMSFLFVHGLLHLLGYDHMTEEDEKVMFKLQDEILPSKEK